MATVQVTISRVSNAVHIGAALPIVASVPEDSETITSSSANKVSAIYPTRADGLVWTISTTGNVFIAFGSAPDAGAGKRRLLLAGQSADFSVTAASEKVAIKDAS